MAVGAECASAMVDQSPALNRFAGADKQGVGHLFFQQTHWVVELKDAAVAS